LIEFYSVLIINLLAYLDLEFLVIVAMKLSKKKFSCISQQDCGQAAF